MAKPRSAWADFGVYLLVRVMVCVIQAMPPRLATLCGRGLAWLAYHVDRRHREIAKDNLRQAFPERFGPAGSEGEAKLDRLVREVYTHFCGMVIEIIRLPRQLHVHNWRNYLDLVGGDQILTAMLSGRPAMIVTGHFGNWEIAGYVLGLLGFTTHAIARPLDNPYLDEYLRSFREATGQRVLAKKGDFDQLTEILAQGGVVATLADQDAGQRGQFVDFFGRPASTHKAVALLSLEYQVPLLVVGVPRCPVTGRYQITVADVVEPSEYAGRPDAVKAITQRYTTALEGLIRKYPEQYFWLHRRWKHQPAVRKGKKAA